ATPNRPAGPRRRIWTGCSPTTCSGWRPSARASPDGCATAPRPAPTHAPWPRRSSRWRPAPGASRARPAPESVAEDLHPGPHPAVVDDLHPEPAAEGRHHGAHRVVVAGPILAHPGPVFVADDHVDVGVAVADGRDPQHLP